MVKAWGTLLAFCLPSPSPFHLETFSRGAAERPRAPPQQVPGEQSRLVLRYILGPPRRSLIPSIAPIVLYESVSSLMFFHALTAFGLSQSGGLLDFQPNRER